MIIRTRARAARQFRLRCPIARERCTGSSAVFAWFAVVGVEASALPLCDHHGAGPDYLAGMYLLSLLMSIWPLVLL